MSTCNQLDLELQGSWPTTPKNFPGTGVVVMPLSNNGNPQHRKLYSGRFSMSGDAICDSAFVTPPAQWTGEAAPRSKWTGQVWEITT